MAIVSRYNCTDINLHLKKNPNYIPIYITPTKIGNVTELRVTKNQGEYLYAISDIDHPDIYHLLSNINNVAKDSVTINKPTGVKRSKQGDIFKFFTKK